ncbi:restriction endonuclease [Planctomycetota bacterium]
MTTDAEADRPIWIVRAGRRAVFAEEFRAEGLVAIGWREVGAIDADADDDEIAELFAKHYPQTKPGGRRVWASQVKRFLRELTVGDPVATYDAGQRRYYLGTIKSDAEWRDQHLARVRSVEWTHKVLRDELTVATRNSLGSIATLFRLSGPAAAEFWKRAVPLEAPDEDKVGGGDEDGDADADKADETLLREEVAERAEQFIEDRIARLDWQEMQELVAGILRAMGYRTRVSEPGPDRGVDIFASPDGLGLQEPRIFVEAKHRPGTSIGSSEVRSFIGGRQTGDRCLYVSTGGFTKEARYEAERSSTPLTLITLPELRELLLDHYENLDASVRSLVPLQRLYWPAD